MFADTNGWKQTVKTLKVWTNILEHDIFSFLLKFKKLTFAKDKLLEVNLK